MGVLARHARHHFEREGERRLHRAAGNGAVGAGDEAQVGTGQPVGARVGRGGHLEQAASPGGEVKGLRGDGRVSGRTHPGLQGDGQVRVSPVEQPDFQVEAFPGREPLRGRVFGLQDQIVDGGNHDPGGGPVREGVIGAAGSGIDDFVFPGRRGAPDPDHDHPDDRFGRFQFEIDQRHHQAPSFGQRHPFAHRHPIVRAVGDAKGQGQDPPRFGLHRFCRDRAHFQGRRLA